MKNSSFSLLVLFCLLVTGRSVAQVPNAAVTIAHEIQIEFNGQWFPGTVAEEKENSGVKYYRVIYSASGGQEWVAPNRVLLDPKGVKPVVGEVKKLPDTLVVGASVSVEYNGGWYPGKLDEIGALSGVPIYKITYAQSGIVEWVAANRLKVLQ